MRFRLGTWFVAPVRWLKGVPRALRPYWGSIASAAVIAGATAWLFSVVRAQEDAQINRLVYAESLRLASEVARHVEARAVGLGRQALAWEAKPPARAEWEADVARLIGQGYEFRTLEWRDHAYAILWVAPAAASLMAGHDERQEEMIRVGLEMRPERGAPWVTPTVPTPEGRRIFFLCVPVLSGRDTSYVVGVMRARDVLDATLADAVRVGYAVAVYEGPYLVYGAVWNESGTEGMYAADAPFDVDGLGWRIQAWPSPEYLRRLRPLAPMAVLTLGILVALLSFVVMLPSPEPVSAGAGGGEDAEPSPGAAPLEAGPTPAEPADAPPSAGAADAATPGRADAPS